MEITLEQIDLIRKRADVNYKEAKEALEKCGGNVVEALAYLEEQNKIKPEKCSQSSCGQKIKAGWKKLNSIFLNISKDEKTILHLPLSFALIVAIISLPLAVAALVIAVFTNCKIRFQHRSGEECCINQKIENLTNKVQEMTNPPQDETK